MVGVGGCAVVGLWGGGGGVGHCRYKELDRNAKASRWSTNTTVPAAVCYIVEEGVGPGAASNSRASLRMLSAATLRSESLGAIRTGTVVPAAAVAMGMGGTSAASASDSGGSDSDSDSSSESGTSFSSDAAVPYGRGDSDSSGGDIESGQRYGNTSTTVDDVTASSAFVTRIIMAKDGPTGDSDRSIVRQEIEDLLTAGIDINAGHSVRAGFPHTGTLLHAAAWYGRDTTARLLIESGANVAAVTSYGWTPLHMAVVRGQHEIVEMLLSQRAPGLVDRCDEKGRTPLMYACSATLVGKGVSGNTNDHGFLRRI